MARNQDRRKDGSTAAGKQRKTRKPQLAIWRDGTPPWPPVPEQSDAEGWPLGFEDELDGVEYEPAPAAVLSARGFLLGRFSNALHALAAMRQWPQGQYVVASGHLVADRDGGTPEFARRAA